MTHQHAIDLDSDDQHAAFFKHGAGIGSRTVLVDADALETERFDEDQPLREDPELWTRLLAECEAERIPEPLAVKRRREDSITGDPDAAYRAEQREIAVLCERFPELEQYRDAREFEAEFRYGRALLRQGDTAAARHTFADLLSAYPDLRDYRVWACYVTSWLPGAVGRRAYGLLERAQEVLK